MAIRSTLGDVFVASPEDFSACGGGTINFLLGDTTTSAAHRAVFREKLGGDVGAAEALWPWRRILLPSLISDNWEAAAHGSELLRQAEQRGEPPVAELREELEQLGLLGLWRETARGYLSDHGFVKTRNESLAQAMARALGIDTDELRLSIAENRIGTALLERFTKPENTTDIAT